MLALSTLGGLTLRRTHDGALLGGPRRKPLAVLALLAAAGDQGVPRDRLVSLLWPEDALDRGRRSLAQAVYALRRDTGRPDVVLGDDVLRLDPAVVASDVAAFRAARARGDHAAAAAGYGGPFLDGVFFKGCVEFERWAEAERVRLSREFVESAAHVAAASTARGDLAGAVVAWERAFDADPLDSRVAADLARALDTAGDRAGALRVLHAHELLLGEHAGAVPTATFRDVAVRVRAGATAPVHQPLQAVSRDVTQPSSRDATPAAAPVAAPRPRRRIVQAALGAGIVFTGALLVAGLRGSPGVAGAASHVDLTVRPFAATEADSSLGAALSRLVAGRLLDEMRTPLAATVDGPGALDGVVARIGPSLSAHAVLRAADGTPLVAADAQAPADSIGRLADRLTVALLARLASVPERHVADLAPRTLPAVHAYIGAEIAYRQNRLEDAQRGYRAALDHDTTLALAALGLAKAGGLGWSAHARSGRSGDALAWRLARRLTSTDRLLFDAYRGSPDAASQTLAARLARWREVHRRLPDRAEPAYEYANALYHTGGWVGDRAGAWTLATGLLRQAIALDSTWTLAYARLIELTAATGDTAPLRAYEARYARLGADPGTALYVRWHAGVFLDDSARQAPLRAALDTLRDGILRRVAGLAQLDGAGLEDADRAVRLLASRVDEPAARVRALGLVRQYALNRGHREEADRALAALRAMGPIRIGTLPNVVSPRQLVIGDALFGDERPEIAETAAREATVGPLPAVGTAPELRAAAEAERCLAGLWWLRAGRPDAARSALASLHAAAPLAPDEVPADATPDLCVETLGAALSVALATGDAPRRLERLDSLAAAGPVVFGAAFVNLVVADLWMARGAPHRALAAVRRRRYDWDAGPEYLAGALLREGTLAAAIGEERVARCALAHYLVLRASASPDVAPLSAAAHTLHARLAARPAAETWADCRRRSRPAPP